MKNIIKHYLGRLVLYLMVLFWLGIIVLSWKNLLSLDLVLENMGYWLGIGFGVFLGSVTFEALGTIRLAKNLEVPPIWIVMALYHYKMDDYYLKSGMDFRDRYFRLRDEEAEAN